MSVDRETVFQTAAPIGGMSGSRVAWSGVFGGAVVGIGALLLLTALGAAIGITAVDPNHPDAGAIGQATAIWTGVSLLLALFIGGWSAARMSMLWDRTAAMFQGTLVWALSMLVILWLAASGIGLLAGQAFGLAGNVARSVGAAVGDSAGEIGSLTQGDADQVLKRLQDPRAVQTLSAATGMTPDESQKAMTDLRGRVETARDDPAKLAEELKRSATEFGDRATAQIKRGAVQAQPAASRTAWFTFAGLVLGLVAGMVGAALGRRNAEVRAGELRHGVGAMERS